MFLSIDNCSTAGYCQCFRSSLDTERVEALESAVKTPRVMEESSVERNSEECLAANVHNVAQDEVNCTNGYETMAMLATRSDDAMTLMMDYKVMVVLLFASPADHSAPECQRSILSLQSPSPTFVAHSRSPDCCLRSRRSQGC